MVNIQHTSPVPSPTERPDLPYLILHGDTPSALVQEVILYRRSGWVLAGGVAVGPSATGGSGLNFYQAVAAPDNIKD